MKAITSTFAALTVTALLGGFGAMGGVTEAAANSAKPMLQAQGHAYYQKKKAKSSAVHNWETKAKAKHGSAFGRWERARKTGFDCNRKFHQGNGKKLWVCKAKGKPVSITMYCKFDKVKAKWIHPTEAGAKAGARDAWEKRAAIKHGMKYSFYNNANSKNSSCGTDSQYPGKILCTMSAFPCR